MDISYHLNTIISLINDYLYSYVLLLVLLGSGVYFTIYTNFIQFNIKNIISAFQEDADTSSTIHHKKISPFEAFAVTAASRIGTGNIAGVAFAIITGGPGTIFWMWITALLGGSLAFAENTLAQIYKIKDPTPHHKRSHYRGGPSYYIMQGLHSPFLSKLFALLLIFVFGLSFNAVQANTISQTFNSSFSLSTLTNALILSGLTALFMFKGLKHIAQTSALLVPFISVIYLLLCIFIIGKNITRIPSVFGLIFANAFGLKEFGIGTLTGTIIIGVRRGLFSNEAGIGSAPNASATAPR